MKSTITIIACAVLSCAALLATAPTVNADTTIDFTSLPAGSLTSAETPGVAVTLEGGPNNLSPNTPWVFSSGFGIINNNFGTGPSGAYPTNNIIDFLFSSPVSGVSFYFNNEGDNSGYNGDTTGTTYTAYDGATIVATGNLSDVEGALVSLSGSEITELVINNNCGTTYCNSDTVSGSYGDWAYEVNSLTYTTVPEPSSFLLLGFGLFGIALLRPLRRRQIA